MKVSIPKPGSHRGEIPRFYTLQRGTRHQQPRLEPPGSRRAELFSPLRPGHLDLLMSVAPTDPSLTRSMNKGRPQRRTRIVPYLNCDRHNMITFVAPSFILWKHSQLFTSQIRTHAKYSVHLDGSCGSITEHRHRRIRPQILHQKLTYLYQLVYHAFQQQSILYKVYERV
jgi:hypothetical protein